MLLGQLDLWKWFSGYLLSGIFNIRGIYIRGFYIWGIYIWGIGFGECIRVNLSYCFENTVPWSLELRKQEESALKLHFKDESDKGTENFHIKSFQDLQLCRLHNNEVQNGGKTDKNECQFSRISETRMRSPLI